MKNKCIVVDIDGTISDPMHRLHFVRRPSKDRDYPSFFGALDKDKPKQEVIDLVKNLAEFYAVILVTARPASYEKPTREWLRKYAVPWSHLIFRPDDNFQSDDEWKKQAYMNSIKPNWDVVAVFDDRQKVVDMWRGLGLTCLQVEAWPEFGEEKYSLADFRKIANSIEWSRVAKKIDNSIAEFEFFCFVEQNSELVKELLGAKS